MGFCCDCFGTGVREDAYDVPRDPEDEKKSYMIIREKKAAKVKSTRMSLPSFVIKHVFDDVMNMESNKWYYGNKENHSIASWQISMKWNQFRKYRTIVIELHDSNYRGPNVVDAIETTTEINFSNSQDSFYYWGYNSKRFEFTSELIEKYLVDGKLTVEMRVIISKLKGIREKLRSFDKPSKEFTDVVLKVKDYKFYVLKSYLAAHSSYFQSLFFGNFDESGKSEIELKGINPYDFQNFLEVIYGESAISDDTIKGISQLADMYGSKTAIRRCDEFRSKTSEMEALRRKCLEETKAKEKAEKLASKYSFQMSIAARAEPRCYGNRRYRCDNRYCYCGDCRLRH